MERIDKVESRRFAIEITNKESVSAEFFVPKRFVSETAVVAAHGAGNGMDHPLLVSFCQRLAGAGYLTVRFNFLYKEQGRKAPDRQEILEQTWQRVFEFVKERAGFKLHRIYVAGKSMGGRVASQLLASGALTADGMIFLGYPLHPAGDKEKLRDGHLPSIKVPMLFFAGTRDPLCDLNLLTQILTRLKPKPQLEIIEGGDHSFDVPKSSPLTRPEVYEKIAARTIEWMKTDGRND